MPALSTKLLRDLWSMKGQAVAILLVVACGAATFVLAQSTLASLSESQTAYYERSRFADVFAGMKRAPNALAERIAEIPGVAAVQPRIVREVSLDIPQMNEPAIGRFISLPQDPSGGLNRLYLRRGRMIEPGRPGELLVSEAFAKAHRFEPGDHLTAILNGRRERFLIVGIAISPEYIMQIQEGNMLPDTKRFGVFWMGYDPLAAAFDMEGAFNNVCLTMLRGASEDDVIKRLDDLTEPYGGVGAYGRDQNISHRYLSDEMKQLKSMTVIAPVIFLGVAAMMLNIVLSRRVGMQRDQIGTLKAFGYSNAAIGRHYLALALSIVAAGVALGTVWGAWGGRFMTKMYAEFYHFPVFDYRLGIREVAGAWAVCMAAGVLGTLSSVRRAALLPPAEAMRPEPPARYSVTLPERLGLGGLLSPAVRMILRNLQRRPLKALFSCLGVATAVAILVLANFGEDAIDHIIDVQFNQSQRFDARVTLVEAASPEVRHELQRLPGVLSSETFRTLPTRMRFGPRSRRVGLTALAREGKLFRLLDEEQRPLPIPQEGLMLSDKLAELLDVRPGDTVQVEVLEDERPIWHLQVAGTVSEFGGTNAYLSLSAMHRLLGDQGSVSGAFLRIDDSQADTLYAELKNTPMVASVAMQGVALKGFRETFAENIQKIKMVNVMFAIVIACGVVYNSMRISLDERRRELATLRVIGFTRGEVSAILLGELGVLTLLAVPLGLALGYGFAAVMVADLDTEMYRIPLVIAPRSYAFAVLIVLAASVISGLFVRRRLDRLDLIQVLKSNE